MPLYIEYAVLLYTFGGILRTVTANCQSSNFDCGRGCLPRDQVCDGYSDCYNSLDEIQCNGTCAPYLFKCKNGKKCLTTTKLCNHKNDCGDNSDEEYCSKVDGCFTHELRGRHGECKRLKDDQDSSTCEDSDCHQSSPYLFNCESGGCVHYESICEIHLCKNCADESDDKYCNGNCPKDYFRCLNDFCIPSSWRCDGFFQCIDDSDEFNCNKLRILQPVEDVVQLEGLSTPVVFRCRAFGEPRPVVKWSKDDLILDAVVHSKYRFTVEGNLEIFNVTLDENGTYTCTAENENGTATSSGALFVKSRTRFLEPPTDTEVVDGSTAMLNCSVTSDPSLTLSVEWLKDGLGVNYTSSKRYSKSYNHSLRIDGAEMGDSGNYTCVVKTELDGSNVTAVVRVVSVPQPPEIGRVECLGLNASVTWKPILATTPPISKYVVSFNTNIQSDKNKWQVAVDDLPSTASSATVTMYPWTNYTFGVQSWNRIGPSLPSISRKICSNPPSAPYQNPANVIGRWINSSETLVISWTAMQQFTHNGPGFRYQVSWKQKQSKERWTNLDILDWRNTSLEVSNLFKNKLYLIQVIALNDQGNAQSQPEQVNVFTGDKDVSTDWLGWPAITSIVLVVLVPTSLFIFASFAYLNERQRRYALEDRIKEFLDGNEAARDEAETEAEKACFLPFTKTLEENEVIIEHGNALGSGNFGKVFAGSYKGSPVAVKTVKASSPIHEIDNFFREIKIMAYIGKHENVVHFIGAVAPKQGEKKSIFAVMELCPLGALVEYLRKHETFGSEVDVDIPSRNIQTIIPLSLRTKISFCRQIANGMEHLVSKTVIHGDLAARNVLVFSNDVLKVSDFGFSRNIYGKTEYKKKLACLPFRWASPETLLNYQFSHKADVWSYGVTTWEIFTLGHCPFAMYSIDEDFIAKIYDGRLRLNKPESAPQDIYDCLMLKCWNSSPDSRPSFQQILHILDEYINKMST